MWLRRCMKRGADVTLALTYKPHICMKCESTGGIRCDRNRGPTKHLESRYYWSLSLTYTHTLEVRTSQQSSDSLTDTVPVPQLYNWSMNHGWKFRMCVYVCLSRSYLIYSTFVHVGVCMPACRYLCIANLSVLFLWLDLNSLPAALWQL